MINFIQFFLQSTTELNNTIEIVKQKIKALAGRLRGYDMNNRKYRTNHITKININFIGHSTIHNIHPLKSKLKMIYSIYGQ